MLNCPELAKRQVLSSLKQGYDGLKRNLLGGPVCAEWQGGSSEGSLPARRPYNGQDYDRYALSRFATKNLAPIACGIGLDELQRVGRGTPAVSDEMCARALLALLGVLELTGGNDVVLRAISDLGILQLPAIRQQIDIEEQGYRDPRQEPDTLPAHW